MLTEIDDCKLSTSAFTGALAKNNYSRYKGENYEKKKFDEIVHGFRLFWEKVEKIF